MDKKTRILLCITLICLILMIISNIVSIYIFIENNKTINNRINLVQEKVKKIELPETIQGEQGIQGIQGVQGYNGEKGDKGDRGDSGPSGDVGKSAFDVATDNGFKGTAADWLISLKGDDGEQGVQGEPGLTPQLRCDSTKNVWQIRYNDDDAWHTMGPEQCTIK